MPVLGIMEQDPLLSSTTTDAHDKTRQQGIPWLLRYRCSQYFILMTVTIAIFTDTFFYAVIVPALPFMLRERCHIPEEDIQFWASTLLAMFGASIVIGSPIGGYVADNMSSRKIPFYAGLGALAASTLLFGLTNNVWVLISSRICFGLSSAIVYTVGLALLIDSVDSDKVGKWIGTALSGATVGITISPLIGGYVYAKFKLQGILVMMITIVVIDIVLRLLMIEREEAALWLGPSVLPNKSLPSGKPGTNNGDHSHSDASQNNTTQNQERAPETHAKSSASMLRLLRSTRVWADLYGVFMNFGILSSFDAVLPLFVRRQFGWTSTEAGLMFLNLAAPTILSPLAGKLVTKFGTRRVAILGCIMACPSLVCMRFITDDSPRHIFLLCVLLVLTGLSLTLVMTPTAADLSFATDMIESREPGVFGKRGAYAQVYALFNCSMAGATVFGPALAGAMQTNFGWANMSWVLGLWSASAAIPVFFLIDDEAAYDGPAQSANGDVA